MEHFTQTFLTMQIRYVQDDSTIFWAIGDNNNVIAKHAEVCGNEIEMTIPFEGIDLGEVFSELLTNYSSLNFSLYMDCVSFFPSHLDASSSHLFVG